MIEYTIFDYDSSEHWDRFDEIKDQVGRIRRDGYQIIELDGERKRVKVERATRLVVQFEDDDEAMLFKLKHL